MRLRFLLLSFCFIILKSINAQNNYWQQQVNYNINVTLNDKDHTLEAFEKLTYTNNSPDTLKYIWFHIWMNAYKNDKTEFSEQLLRNGRTDFYFSDEKDRGYTSKLDFKVDDVNAKFEYHPQHIDIIKLLLPKALAPHQTITIETPFHTQLPYNFSRGGHILRDYQITQWYPKPAVYDKYGWHEMPYLDQGEFYSDFGSFEVSITVPENYLVAATGELQTETELKKLKELGKTKFENQPNYKIEDEVEQVKTFMAAQPVKKLKVDIPKNKTSKTKTLVYTQNNIHDFAWFASKNFLVEFDTLKLNNRTIDCFSFFPRKRISKWINYSSSIKSTLKKYSKWVGEYPYNTATVVIGKQNNVDGMEYPTITYINDKDSMHTLHETISHELGHNWFYGILASNERHHAWMDEGMNTYYDNRYSDENPRKILTKINGKKIFVPDTAIDISTFDEINTTLNGIAKNIPIDTTADAFPKEFYGLKVYELASNWMLKLQSILGKQMFDSVMRTYYQQWKFKHPYPQDFKKVVEQVSGKNIDEHFAKLTNNKPLATTTKKPFKIGFVLPTKNIDKYKYLSISPTVSYNYYDGIRLGIALHNYQLPLPKFQFVANPCIGTTSNNFNLFGRASYNIYKKNYWLELSTSYQNYSYKNFIVVDDKGNKEFSKPLTLQRFVPQVKLTLYNKDLRSTERTVIGFKTFYLNKQDINYTNKDTNYTYKTKSYINRLFVSKFDNRVLYPYEINFIADQTEDLLRLSLTAKEFFNYGKGKDGISARFFAGKIFYLKQKTSTLQYNNYNYWFNLIGTTGEDDYTYSDYFVGRSEQQRGWKGQQIMERDGFLKTRMDYVSPVGRTDDWLMAVNLNADIPGTTLLKVFADLGTYAEAWKNNDANGRFLFTSGLQISLFKNTVNIYAPLFMSKVFRDYNDLYLQDNKFLKSISFSINLQNLHLTKFNRNIPL